MKKKSAEEVFSYFSQLEGAQHIASLKALEGIEDLIIRDKKIKNIFEFGTGIGTIPFLISKLATNYSRTIKYIGTEKNEFCLNAIRKNISNNSFFTYSIIGSVQEVKPGEKFDLIIIDGSVNEYSPLKDILSSDGIVIIEGDRKAQLQEFLKVFPGALVNRIVSRKRNSSDSIFQPGNFVGGYTKIMVHPGISNYIKFLINKFETALNYRLRRLN